MYGKFCIQKQSTKCLVCMQHSLEIRWANKFFEVCVTAGYNVGWIFALLYIVSIGIGRDKGK